MFNNDHSATFPSPFSQVPRVNTPHNSLNNPPPNTAVPPNIITWSDSVHSTPSVPMYTTSTMTMTFPSFDPGPSTSSGVYHHQSMFQFPPYHVPFDYQQVNLPTSMLLHLSPNGMSQNLIFFLTAKSQPFKNVSSMDFPKYRQFRSR